MEEKQKSPPPLQTPNPKQHARCPNPQPSGARQIAKSDPKGEVGGPSQSEIRNPQFRPLAPRPALPPPNHSPLRPPNSGLLPLNPTKLPTPETSASAPTWLPRPTHLPVPLPSIAGTPSRPSISLPSPPTTNTPTSLTARARRLNVIQAASLFSSSYKVALSLRERSHPSTQGAGAARPGPIKKRQPCG
jgi:hypothetical protein